MADRFQVQDTTTLLLFLTESLQGWSRKKVKQRLQSGCVTVNGNSISKHDYPLNPGDQVEVLASPVMSSSKRSSIEILYQDKDLIAINKPYGLLSVASSKENKDCALAILRNQLTRSKKSVKLWPVHRLDRETSGVLLFATSKNMREAVVQKWPQAEKHYLAIVEGRPTPSQGTIDQPLRLDEKEYRVHVGPHPHAKKAVTHYQTKEQKGNRSLLQVKIETGRQHQIRAHLAYIGCPIVGDERYGIKGPRMGLHAQRLSIIHPISGQRIQFTQKAPDDFLSLMS